MAVGSLRGSQRSTLAQEGSARKPKTHFQKMAQLTYKILLTGISVHAIRDRLYFGMRAGNVKLHPQDLFGFCVSSPGFS
jgi:hypothetical protein